MTGHAGRAVPWGLLAVGATLVTLLLLLVERWPYTLWPLQGTAVGLLAATAVWSFDEPAASVADTLPRGLFWRTVARASGPLALLLVWAVVVTQTRTGYFGHAADVAWQGVAAVVAGSGFVTWRRFHGAPDPARNTSAAIVSVATFVALARPFDQAVPVFPYTATDDWTTSRLMWSTAAGLLLVAGLVPLAARLRTGPRPGEALRNSGDG
jgi:hypothetical protein